MPPSTIPLSHKPQTTGYKLLELPQELVDLLESKDPPTLTISPSQTSAILSAGNNQKSYSLRQKNTSNALIILSPFDNPVHGTPGVSTIATIHETIELIPLPTTTTTTTTTNEPAAALKPRGKWHEKFGKGR
ncbi:hypothetical protein QBC43DRAFT_324297 [Cladorrhinum sp. PSN259]|nr:hypothetical protein QBC43DRAFT_324297 [Cladorrhinum sp. PSN259]